MCVEVKSDAGQILGLSCGRAGSACSSVLIAAGCSSGSSAAPASPPPPSVEVAPVIQRDTPIYNDWVAVLDGYVNAQIQPRVSGYIIKQNYSEGEAVRTGDVLFEIDPRPFIAALDQAKAQLRKPRPSLARPRSMSSALGRDAGEIQGKPIVDMGAEGFAGIRPYVERVLGGERVEYESHVRRSAQSWAMRACFVRASSLPTGMTTRSRRSRETRRRWRRLSKMFWISRESFQGKSG